MNRLTGKIGLDFRSAEPLYLQIARQIEQMVLRNELMVGDQLPTVREMATELRINFNTVDRAYRLLDENHLISTQRGRGTYIWEQPTQDLMRQLRQKNLEDLSVHYLKQALQLGYSFEEVIGKLNQLKQSGGFE